MRYFLFPRASPLRVRDVLCHKGGGDSALACFLPRRAHITKVVVTYFVSHRGGLFVGMGATLAIATTELI